MSFVLIRECASSIINKIDRKINIAGPKNIILKGSAKKQKEGELVMRLNKKKLAAVMMSAVMAASVMPVTAFAETEGEPVAAAANAAITVVGVTFDQNGKAVVTYSNNDTKELQGVRVTAKPATCTEAEQLRWSVTVGNDEYRSDFTFDGAAALGHDYVAKEETIKAATCTEPGQKRTYEACTRCSQMKPGSEVITDTIVAEHQFGGDVLTKYIDQKNVTVDADGKATLINDFEDGSYVKVTYQLCQVCKKAEGNKTEEKITVPATNRQVTARIKSGSLKNIAAGQEAELLKQFQATTPDYSKIILTNCKEDGTFVVEYVDAANTVIYTPDKVTVAAHHVYNAASYTVKFKTTEDGKRCTWTYDAKKNVLNVVNNYCKDSGKTIAYDEVATCTVCSAKETTAKTAQPAGTHVVNQASKSVVEAAAEAAKNLANGLDTKSAEYKALANLKNIKFTTTATCDEAGVATVTYICTDCGKEASSVSFKTTKLQHENDKDVIENKVAATCVKDGSYDVVVYCKHCGKELSRKTVVDPKTGHSFAKDGSGYGIKFTGSVVVDYDSETQKGAADAAWTYGLGGYSKSFSVYPVAYQECDTCGEKVEVTDEVNAKKLNVVSVTKEDGKGNPGSIVVNASYKVTTEEGKTITIKSDDVKFNYFSNMVAYLERNPAADALDGLHKDEDGVWRYYVNDVFQEDYVGIVEFEGGEFFVANGVLCSEAEGLNQNIDGKWYFLSQGQIQRVDGFAEYDNAWFMLKNGELDLNANGLYGYNGGTFLFAAGKLRTDYSGLWQNPATQEWVFLANGQLQDQYTGIAKYDGHEFKLVNGKLVA